MGVHAFWELVFLKLGRVLSESMPSGLRFLALLSAALLVRPNLHKRYAEMHYRLLWLDVAVSLERG
jgi:hypothetical protein